MSDITLTKEQADGVKRTVEWFKGGTKKQQIWRIFGFAGTGKSTVLKFILDEINATHMPRISGSSEARLEQREEVRELSENGAHLVLSAAYTGKAALVMTRKGTPASTIHSMLYIPQEPTKEAIEKARKDLAELQAKGPGEDHPTLWRALIRDRETQIKNMHKPTFVLNVDSMVRDASLVVLDEVSMVGEEMATDLLSFRKPILVLGDPGQLPPIKGEGTFTQAEPDVMLTEIMRQAAESPIIRLATMAREGRFIPFGKYSDEVWKMQRNQVPVDQYLAADQVLCGFNATRYGLNNQMKAVAGYDASLPVGNGEKIICLKNKHSDGLINGQFLKLSNVGDAGEFAFMADIETEDGDNVGRQSIYRGHFDDHVTPDKERDHRDYFNRKGKVECVWGWACTVHKFQGSQAKNIILIDDGFGRGDDRRKWLYTALSRSEEGLLILA